MSQIKAYIPEVAVKVGIQASLLLQHIKYWVEEYNLDKVYRTNKQISEDFKGTLSESQIQRAKKKLVEAGLIIVSHDKGHTRTTHYKLTDEAMKLMSVVKKVVDKLKDGAKKLSGNFKKPTPANVPSGNSKSMEEEFAKAGVNKNAVAMPNSVLEALGRKPKTKQEPVVETVEVVEPVSIEVVENNFIEHVDFNDEDQFFDEHELDDLSVDADDYFKALDFGMQQVQEQKVEEPKMSFGDLMSQAFNRVPNIETLEKNRKMMEDAKYFKEDF